jgi:signal transduction histidine kinase
MLAFPEAVRARLEQVSRPGAAFALPLIALGVQELLWPVIRPLAFLLLFPAVFASAYLGGLTVGLTSVGITAVLGYVAFIDPRYSLLKDDSGGLLQTLVFITVGVYVAVMLHRLDAATRRMAAALRAADRAEDNERVARDLHDAVLHRLFATGVLLSTAESLEHPDDLRAVLNDARGDLQEVTGTIRNAIFDLRHGGHLDGVQRAISDMVDDTAVRLNCHGHAVFRGPVNEVVGDQAAEALLAVTQEALTNIARHAQATQFTVTVDVTGNGLTLTVTDNGVGIPTPVLRGSGLRGMATRAEQLGGICVFEPGRQGSGTTIRWSAYRDIGKRNTHRLATMADIG